MTKAKEFAEGYMGFWYNSSTNQWQATFMPMLPTSVGGSQKYYKVRIPVPDEILADELPNMDEISVK